MKKLKLITTQDHVLLIVETIHVNEEITCRPTNQETKRAVLPAETTALMCDGTVSYFVLDSSDNWVKSDEKSSPRFAIAASGEQGGSSVSSVSRVIEIQSKDRVVSDIWREFNHLTNEQVDIITDPSNRESFIELFSVSDEHLVDPDTFSDLGTSSVVEDSEITIL